LQSAERDHRTVLLAKLHARYRAPLLAFFQRRSRSLAEAEDLTQEVFVRLARRPATAQATSDGFIFTIAANLLRDNARRSTTHARDSHITIEHDHHFDEPLTDSLEPERILLSRDLLARAVRVLERLNPRTRDIFLLFRLEGVKQRDIAQLFGISVSAVEKHIAKALGHLADEFKHP
jgi:RNA polymerase sigma-70 factor (ECF subfamily)